MRWTWELLILAKRITKTLCCLCCALSLSLPVQASNEQIGRLHKGIFSKILPDKLSAEMHYTTAFETRDDDHSLSRFTLIPKAQWRFGSSWRAETSLRLEYADDDTGLGGVSGYSDASKPWLADRRARVELDRAHLTYRSGATRIRVGKQVTAWGVLDGLRITDRFDAVRRRDFVYTPIRPERIARWGIHARTDAGHWTVEMSAALDPTVSQQANLQDAYAPQATRFTGGLDITTLGPTALSFRTSGRNAYGRDLTYGVRSSRDIGTGRLSLLAFRGPTTDPLIDWASALPGSQIELRFPHRTLIGASFDYTLGGSVLRAELAVIPDQGVNVSPTSSDQNPDISRPAAFDLAIDEQTRWLAGIGIDLNAPFGVFINAQLALDHMREGDLSLVRPQTDLIGTLRAQRSFPQSGWRAQIEWLGSLTDGDGVVRPEVRHDVNSYLSLSLGGDFAFGDSQGIFGQFVPRNRAWLRVELRL